MRTCWTCRVDEIQLSAVSPDFTPSYQRSMFSLEANCCTAEGRNWRIMLNSDQFIFSHNFSKVCIALINRFTAAKRARHSATFSSVLFSPFSTDIIRLHFHSILHGSRIFATIPSFAYLLKFLSLVSKKYIGVLCAESDAAMGCLSVCPSRAGIVRRNDCLFVTTRCTAKPNVSPPGSAASHQREENQFSRYNQQQLVVTATSFEGSEN